LHHGITPLPSPTPEKPNMIPRLIPKYLKKLINYFAIKKVNLFKH
jgi:hypothetical protein